MRKGTPCGLKKVTCGSYEINLLFRGLGIVMYVYNKPPF
jgi:hypothetical protein